MELIITSLTSLAKPRGYGSVIIYEARSIYDGSTFRATINSWHPLIGKGIGIKVKGVDTPEKMRGKCEQGTKY